MIIKNNLMFSVDKIKYIDIQERPVFNYDTKKYSKTKYIIVVHIDLNSHEVNNINLEEFESKKEAKKYLSDFATIIYNLKTNKLEKIEL